MHKRLWMRLVASAAAVMLMAPTATAEILPPLDQIEMKNLWYSGDSPAEEAFVQSDYAGAFFLIAGCDAMDGIYPYLAIGVMDFVNWRVKEQALGFKREPTGGVLLTVKGTTRAGPFSFKTTGAGPGQGVYGGTITGRNGQTGDRVVVQYAGGSITPAQLRLLMQANDIMVTARGADNKFSARGSAKAIGRLSCTADID